MESLIEKAISEWEKTDIKNRRWDQLCKDVFDPRRFRGKKEKVTANDSKSEKESKFFE